VVYAILEGEKAPYRKCGMWELQSRALWFVGGKLVVYEGWEILE